MLTPKLRLILKTLPTEPGVYRMRDAGGTVIYVGKAINLKKRVSSYFQKQHHAPKTTHLVAQIESIDITVTRSEKEALLLENSLIKALKPKYNVLMRDDKSYPYLHMRLDHPFPSLKMVRCKEKPSAKMYFGPYPNVQAVKEALQLIQKVFKLRNCSDVDFNSRTRPCLQYQLKRCTAPCTQLITEEAYRQSVRDASAFLEGKSQEMLLALQTRMNVAATAMHYEEAAVLRDQIQQLRIVQEQQAIYSHEGCLDVVVMETEPACIQWVSIRKGQMIDSQVFFPQAPENSVFDTLRESLFKAFLMHYYGDSPTRIPELILTDVVLSEQHVLEDILSEWRQKRCRIQTNARGAKARWLDFAKNNLQVTVSTRQVSQTLLKQRYEALRLFLQRELPIQRLVCFDISHTQGQETVASCVVFDASGPLKRAYRRFNLHLATPGDDYAAMLEVVSRYFSGLSQEEWPDIILIDGGRGQVAEAKKALEGFGAHDHTLIGIVKGPDRKAAQDHLWLAQEEAARALPQHHPALHLLQHLRDEAHRFAISAHRKKRARASLSSSLTTIPGVGAKRRYALLQYFGGIQSLAKASIEEISKVSGISEKLAKEIYQHFHQ